MVQMTKKATQSMTKKEMPSPTAVPKTGDSKAESQKSTSSSKKSSSTRSKKSR